MMQPGCIHVYLGLGQNIHMGLTTSLTACQFIKRLVPVVAQFLIKDCALAVNTTKENMTEVRIFSETTKDIKL